MSNAHRPAGRYLIGLTGNIACGKSTVLAELAALGAETIDADQLVHELYVAGSPVTAAIAAAFGTAILMADGGVDRRALGRLVFAEPARLRQLEQITHPAVRHLIEQRLAASQAAVIVIDAIKLIEGGLAARCNSLWVVICPPEQQLARLMDRNQLTRAEAEQRIAAQSPVAAKLAQADLIIDNGGSREATRAQVERAWRQLPRPACTSSK